LWLSGLIALLVFAFARFQNVYRPNYTVYDWNLYVVWPEWTIWLWAMRWPMRITALIVLSVLGWLEWRGAALSLALAETLSHKGRTVLALVLVGALSGSYFLLPGHIAAADDAEAYTGFVALMQHSLRLGQWPIWTNYGGMGGPLFQFYGPLYSLLVAMVAVIVPDLFEATKITLFGLHLISVFGLFTFVEKLTGARFAGFVAACVYGFAFYRYHVLVLLGVLHAAVHFALMPWQFYCLENIARPLSDRRYWVACGLLSGAFWLGHPQVGLFANAFALLYGLLRLWLRPEAWTVRGKLKALRQIGLGFGGGLLIGGYPLITAFVEGSQTALAEGDLGRKFFPIGALTLTQVFTFRGSYLTSDWFGGYIGLTVLALTLLGLSMALWHRNWHSVPLIVCLSLSLYLTLGPGHWPFDEIFQNIPLGNVVYTFATPGRYLIYVCFFCAVAVGIAAAELAKVTQFRAIRPERLGWVLLALVAVDMLPISLLSNALRPPTFWQVEGRTAAYTWIQANITDTASRILEPEVSPYNSDIHLAIGFPSFGTTAHEVPLHVSRTIQFTREKVNADLKAGNLTPLSQKWLYLTNTSAMVTGQPLPQTLARDFVQGRYAVIAVPAHSPILAGRRLLISADPANLDSLLATMDIDPSSNSVAAIPVIADGVMDSGPAPVPVAVRVLNHKLQPQSVSLTYDLSAPGYIQLSYGYYPYLNVYLDGEPVSATESVFGLIVFRSPAGQHTVDLKPYLSPLRQVLLAGAGAWLIVAAIIWMKSSGTRQHPHP
jgi:hypothetical protein